MMVKRIKDIKRKFAKEFLIHIEGFKKKSVKFWRYCYNETDTRIFLERNAEYYCFKDTVVGFTSN